MTLSDDSSWLKAFFTRQVRDLTPDAWRPGLRILLAPVVDDPDITRRCASMLSAQEQGRATRFVKPPDRSLFVQRRAFRRFCGALAMESTAPLAQIDFRETDTGRPQLPDLPGTCFSFASCHLGYVGAWSATDELGIDIEDRTRDPGAAAMARHFFAASEATGIEETGRNDGAEALRDFYRLWCLKEAALKSIGEGLPFGLDAFEFRLSPRVALVAAPASHGGSGQFSARVVESGASCIAVVKHRVLS